MPDDFWSLKESPLWFQMDYKILHKSEFWNRVHETCPTVWAEADQSFNIKALLTRENLGLINFCR